MNHPSPLSQIALSNSGCAARWNPSGCEHERGRQAKRLMAVCWPAVLNEEMEGVWSSGVALRGETSNHPEVR